MNNFVINIGLNNNPKSVNNIVNDMFNYFVYTEAFYIMDSEYKGEKEKTIVFEGKTSFDIFDVVRVIQNFCERYKQESIAIKTDQYDLLIYNREYKGEKMKFNNKYFKQR